MEILEIKHPKNKFQKAFYFPQKLSMHA